MYPNIIIKILDIHKSRILERLLQYAYTTYLLKLFARTWLCSCARMQRINDVANPPAAESSTKPHETKCHAPNHKFVSDTLRYMQTYVHLLLCVHNTIAIMYYDHVK